MFRGTRSYRDILPCYANLTEDTAKTWRFLDARIYGYTEAHIDELHTLTK